MKFIMREMTQDDVMAVIELTQQFAPDARATIEALGEILHNPRVSASVAVKKPCLGTRLQIIGYLITVYDVEKDALRVAHLLVGEKHRRKGVGRKLLECSKLLSQRLGTMLLVRVTEENLDAQKFLRSQNMRCVTKIKRHFNDGRDALSFHFPVENTTTNT